MTKDYLVFCSGHFITYAGDQCERIHGHNYRVAVEVEDDLDGNHYVFDFIALKDLTRAIVNEIDHRMLLPTESDQIRLEDDGPNNIRATYQDRYWSFPRAECALLPIANTTAELLADYIATRLRRDFHALGLPTPRVLRVEVEESFGQAAEVEWRRDGLNHTERRMNMKPWIVIFLALAFAPAVASAAEHDAHHYNRLLGRGMNLGNALDAPSEGEWGVTLKPEYFEAIKKAGFDSVRIPTRWATHVAKGSTDQIDPKFFERVDWAIDQALSRGLIAVVNIHHDNETFKDPSANLPRVESFWRQIATRYKDRPDRLYFELLNEPNGEMTDEKWQAAFPKLLAAIRESNPKRVVIIGPGHWNGIDSLAKFTLPESDRMLISTVHYYNPFKFTHQDAEWVPESKAWKGTTWRGTPDQIKDLKRDFAKVEKWAKDHDRPIYVGEFGAYSGADIESREQWTAAVAREAERLNFSWAYWEFASGFGAFDPQTDTWRAPLLKAMIPPRVALSR